MNQSNDLENVFERCSGEVGGNTFIPAPSFLERNIVCGWRDYVSACFNFSREVPQWHSSNSETRGGGEACSLQNCGGHWIWKWMNRWFWLNKQKELGLLHSVDIRLRIFRENLMMFVHFVVYYIGLKILLGFLLGLGNGSIL